MLDRTTIPAGSTLRELVDTGCSDASAATAVLKATLEILAAQTKYCFALILNKKYANMSSRVPVLLAVDDFQALYGRSLYRDPDFKFIQALYLSMPRLVLEFASGRSVFVRLYSAQNAQ